jgi:hypothetical protein
MDLLFQLETEIEEQICPDVAWQQGVIWREPRPGHSEGQVIYHKVMLTMRLLKRGENYKFINFCVRSNL